MVLVVNGSTVAPYSYQDYKLSGYGVCVCVDSLSKDKDREQQDDVEVVLWH